MKSFINGDGIMGMVNITMLKPDQLSQFFKEYNNGLPDPIFHLVISKYNGLAGLLWWAMYSKIRGRSLDLNTFTSDVISKSLASFGDYLRKKDNTSSLKLPSFQ